MAFYPHTQRPDAISNFVVRFSGPASAVVPQIRQTIKQINRNLPVDDVVNSFRSHQSFARPTDTRRAARVVLRTAGVVAGVCRVVRRDVLRRGATHE